MHQIVCRLGLCMAPPDPLAGLGVGPTGNGKERGEKRREGMGGSLEGNGREGSGGRPGTRADPRGPGVHGPPSLACAIFFARGCWRSDIPRSLHPSALSTELLKVSELPHLSLTLTVAQPRCNCKCNLTLTLDSCYNGRHALAWEYQL